MTDGPRGTYTCRYCRLPSDASAPACPNCGAPVDVKAMVSRSGWEPQPPIKDMARIQFGRSTCQIEGTYVPVADFGLAPAQPDVGQSGGGEWVYFSHHHLLWAEPGVDLATRPMSGGWNRVRAGLPLVMMQAHGPGHLALSDDSPGEVVAIPIQHGQEVWVREHRFLAATGNVGYRWDQSGIWYVTGSGDDQETHYPVGMYIDRFFAQGGPGLLLLHSPGNTFIRDLPAGETICIQPSSLLYKDPTVGMQLHLEYPHSAGLSWGRAYSYRHIWLRMWGPGRVAVQSVFERPEDSGYVQRSSPATVAQW
ncbi:MAG: AIM24 family protein [Acidimicrobiales bacterium]